MIDIKTFQEKVGYKLLWTLFTSSLSYLSIFGLFFFVLSFKFQFPLQEFFLVFIMGLILNLLLSLTPRTLDTISGNIILAICTNIAIIHSPIISIDINWILIAAANIYIVLNTLYQIIICQKNQKVRGLLFLSMHIFKILFIVLGVSALGYLNIDQNITVSPFFINQKIAINYIQIYIMINLLSLVINFAYSIITLFALNSKLFSIAQNLKRVCSWSLDENVLTNQIMHGQEELSNQERTILFGDIRGFTSFSNNNTNQIITFALRDFYETVEEVTEKYSAYKPEFIADEFITFFPTSKDAVDCALELRAKLTKSLKQYDLDVGMGLHRGEVLEGVIGGKFSKKYSVIGNAANIANRLEGTAKSREILCSKEVKRQIDHSYISSKRTVTLKGISDNFAAYSIKTKKGSIKNKTAKKQNDFKITPFKYAANILNKLGIEY